MSNKLHEKVELSTVVTCPSCNHKQTMMMPRNFCERSFHCYNCKKDHAEKPGDCCIFCSYGQL